MITRPQRILFCITAGLVTIDMAWGLLGQFHVDVLAYAKAGLLGLVLLAAGIFYQTRRPDPKLAAMILGASFLILFSAAANLLNNYLLTVAGSRIDAQIDAADRALGFDWYRMMLAMADYPVVTRWLFYVYNIALPEIALLLVVLAWSGSVEKAYRFCISVAAGALIAIGLWAIHPAFGAMSLYTLPHDVAAKLMLSLTCEFGKAQVLLLRDGPGFITPDALHGSLIGFPSYHAVLAILVVWYARRMAWLRWPALLLNIGVLVSTPVQGGHHLIDVLAAFPIAALAIFAAGARRNAHASVKASTMVNKMKKFTITPVPEGFFRITPEQKQENTAPAIKSKLSGVS